MSNSSQIGPAPSTLARVASDLSASRNRLDAAATDLERLADALCGSLGPQAETDGSLNASTQPSGSVNVLDVLATGLSTPAARIEFAISRIQSAIG